MQIKYRVSIHVAGIELDSNCHNESSLALANASRHVLLRSKVLECL